MLRRAFLQKSLAAAALAPLVLPSRLLGRDPSAPAPSSLLQVGFIGLGGQGNGVLGGFLDHPRVRVTALCDVDREHLRKAAERVETHYASAASPSTPSGPAYQTTDFRDLLARDLDAVVIATPDHWHAIPVIAAARRGLHIYLEKPFALTIPEGRAMVRAIEQAGVVCQVGSQQRSSSEFQRVVELARNGFFGRVTKVEVGLPAGRSDIPQLTAPLAPQAIPAHLDYDLWLGPAPAAPYYSERCHFHFRWISDYSGGQLSDWIGHHYDIASWALGVDHTGPVALRDASATFPAGPLYDTADQYAFSAHYAGGQVIQVSTAFRSGLRIEGDQGWAHVDRGVSEFSDARLRRAPIPSQGFVIDRRNTWHTGNFIDGILLGRPVICPPETSHCAATVAHLANLAFRTGRSTLRWDPATETILDAPDAAARLCRPYRGPWTLV